MDRPDPDWVSEILCFHAQQAIEKALKTFLIAHGKTPPRTHSVEILIEQCIYVDQDFPRYPIRDISYFAVEARYPGETFQPDPEETRYYAQLAHSIVSDIKGKLGI